MNPLVWVIAAGLGGSVSSLDPTRLVVPADGSQVHLLGITHPSAGLIVRPVRGPELLGKVEVLRDRMVFRPLLPFLPGQRYRAEWRAPDGSRCLAEFESPARNRERPTVRLTPQSPLPANAIKVYLHFSKPMEQGVFLHCLRLLDASGNEIAGPFRETELWSPDGKRLTVWFHPGRQKTGVNLNLEEGPVLRPGQRHTLILAKDWRDTNGIALGEEIRLPFTVGPEDHQSPDMGTWKLTPPRVGSLHPLVVRFPEPLDPAMLAHSLSVISGTGASLPLAVETEPDGKTWKAFSPEPWKTGAYKLLADPLLEDLAGNSLDRPFTINLRTRSDEIPGAKPVLALDWQIEP
ncbi:MAG: hypothetical protein KGS60_13825 [Verrucomicrobia bacterium]|nr:hypothetical protein [Verrucomicrobiota bacterium]